MMARPKTLLFICIPTTLLIFAGVAVAQSGSRSPYRGGSNSRSLPSSGSTTRNITGSTTRMLSSPAMGGYCPVCVLEMKQWMKGSPNHTATFDGKTYHFPGDKQRKMFLSNPAKYAPVLGGDCIVCFADSQQRMAGSVQHATIYRDRLYLFPSSAQKQKFRSDLRRYERADVAYDGNCVVCNREMNEQVPGKPEFTAIHRGLRYFFPSDKQRKMFLANPQKYVSNSNIGQLKLLGNARAGNSKTNFVRAVGASGCAACDYGVKPIGSPQELGLAITNGQNVFVVEDAHRLYPNIYKSRFDGLKLAVKGKVIQQKGNFRWIQPTDLRLTQ